MCSNDETVIFLPDPSILVFLRDGYLQEYRSMEDYQRGEGEGGEVLNENPEWDAVVASMCV